jgi:hypothetical protein
MSRTIAHEKKNKYAKSSFSREKTFATSEQEILKNEKKMNEYNMKRGAEREANIRTASGITDDKVIEKTNDKTNKKINNIKSPKFYFEKMNFVIYDLPPRFNIDGVLREFSQYGKMLYIRYNTNYEGYKLVVDEWSEDHADTISEIQMNIWEKGRHEWTSGSYIARDPEQTLADLGDKVEWDDDEDDDANDLNNMGNY